MKVEKIEPCSSAAGKVSWPASRLMTPLAGLGLLHQLDGLEVNIAAGGDAPHRAQMPPLAVVLAAADEGGEGRPASARPCR